MAHNQSDQVLAGARHHVVEMVRCLFDSEVSALCPNKDALQRATCDVQCKLQEHIDRCRMRFARSIGIQKTDEIKKHSTT
jgi:hypothetical protein